MSILHVKGLLDFLLKPEIYNYNVEKGEQGDQREVTKAKAIADLRLSLAELQLRVRYALPKKEKAGIKMQNPYVNRAKKGEPIEKYRISHIIDAAADIIINESRKYSSQIDKVVTHTKNKLLKGLQQAPLYEGYNYLGQGTDLLHSIKYNIQPTNELDRIAMEHDFAYALIAATKNKQYREKNLKLVDDKFIKDALELAKDSKNANIRKDASLAASLIQLASITGYTKQIIGKNTYLEKNQLYQVVENIIEDLKTLESSIEEKEDKKVINELYQSYEEILKVNKEDLIIHQPQSLSKAYNYVENVVKEEQQSKPKKLSKIEQLKVEIPPQHKPPQHETPPQKLSPLQISESNTPLLQNTPPLKSTHTTPERTPQKSPEKAKSPKYDFPEVKEKEEKEELTMEQFISEQTQSMLNEFGQHFQHQLNSEEHKNINNAILHRFMNIELYKIIKHGHNLGIEFKDLIKYAYSSYFVLSNILYQSEYEKENTEKYFLTELQLKDFNKKISSVLQKDYGLDKKRVKQLISDIQHEKESQEDIQKKEEIEQKQPELKESEQNKLVKVPQIPEAPPRQLSMKEKIAALQNQSRQGFQKAPAKTEEDLAKLLQSITSKSLREQIAPPVRLGPRSPQEQINPNVDLIKSTSTGLWLPQIPKTGQRNLGLYYPIGNGDLLKKTDKEKRVNREWYKNFRIVLPGNANGNQDPIADPSLKPNNRLIDAMNENKQIRYSGKLFNGAQMPPCHPPTEKALHKKQVDLYNECNGVQVMWDQDQPKNPLGKPIAMSRENPFTLFTMRENRNSKINRLYHPNIIIEPGGKMVRI